MIKLTISTLQPAWVCVDVLISLAPDSGLAAGHRSPPGLYSSQHPARSIERHHEPADQHHLLAGEVRDRGVRLLLPGVPVRGAMPDSGGPGVCHRAPGGLQLLGGGSLSDNPGRWWCCDPGTRQQTSIFLTEELVGYFIVS